MEDQRVKNDNIDSTDTMTLIICPICSECYTLEGSFKLHYRAHKRTFRCKHCEKVFYLKRHLLEHQNDHASKEEYACDVCSKVYSKKSQLKIHQRSHVVKIKKEHVCDACDRSFSTKSALKKHTSTHYICDICNNSFENKSKLLMHSCGLSVKKPLSCDTIIESVGQSNLNEEFENEVKQEDRICKSVSEKSRADAVSEEEFDESSSSKGTWVSVKILSEVISSNIVPNDKSKCEFCKRGFLRKSSLMSHRCTKKK